MYGTCRTGNNSRIGTWSWTIYISSVQYLKKLTDKKGCLDILFGIVTHQTWIISECDNATDNFYWCSSYTMWPKMNAGKSCVASASLHHLKVQEEGCWEHRKLLKRVFEWNICVSSTKSVKGNGNMRRVNAFHTHTQKRQGRSTFLFSMWSFCRFLKFLSLCFAWIGWLVSSTFMKLIFMEL